jgi:Tfp pilus assembly pilus retraction ATPase PilT
MGLYEFMINNIAVRNNIKKWDIRWIDNIIETSSNQWMISMQSYAKRLVAQWLVSEDQVSRLFISANA